MQDAIALAANLSLMRLAILVPFLLPGTDLRNPKARLSAKLHRKTGGSAYS